MVNGMVTLPSGLAFALPKSVRGGTLAVTTVAATTTAPSPTTSVLPTVVESREPAPRKAFFSITIRPEPRVCAISVERRQIGARNHHQSFHRGGSQRFGEQGNSRVSAPARQGVNRRSRLAGLPTAQKRRSRRGRRLQRAQGRRNVPTPPGRMDFCARTLESRSPFYRSAFYRFCR